VRKCSHSTPAGSVYTSSLSRCHPITRQRKSWYRPWEDCPWRSIKQVPISKKHNVVCHTIWNSSTPRGRSCSSSEEKAHTIIRHRSLPPLPWQSQQQPNAIRPSGTSHPSVRCSNRKLFPKNCFARELSIWEPC